MKIVSKKSDATSPLQAKRAFDAGSVKRIRLKTDQLTDPSKPVDDAPKASKLDRVRQSEETPKAKSANVLELRRIVNGKETIVIKDKHLYKDGKLEELYPDYQVRFAIVNAMDILNICSPEFNYRPLDWSSDEERNKRYQIGRRYMQAMNDRVGFYDKLEKSILADGFRNPIVITTGYPKFRSIEEVPPELRGLPTEMMICELIGGSRLLVAQKHRMLIPAIINDFTGIFTESPLLKTPEAVASYFNDKPKDVLFTNRGLRITPPAHTHLDAHAQSPRVVMDIRRQAIKVAYE